MERRRGERLAGGRGGGGGGVRRSTVGALLSRQVEQSEPQSEYKSDPITRSSVIFNRKFSPLDTHHTIHDDHFKFADR